jgi:hypothetical protein
MGSGLSVGCWVNLATWVLQGVARNQARLRPSALCQPLSEKVVTTFQTANAASTPAAVPIARQDLTARRRDDLKPKLRMHGWPLRRIAKAVDMSPSGVAHALERIGTGRPGRDRRA